MGEKKYLNEEKYQKTSKKLFYVGVGLILIGIVIALVMVVPKLTGGTKSNKEDLEKQLLELKPALELRYAELETQGFEESWDYKDKEGYEMTLIDIALDPRMDKCEHSTLYSDHATTREYCKVKAELYDANNINNNGGILFTIVPALMVLMPCCAIGAMIIMTAKRREIMAFTAQQVMPVGKEVIDEMAPSAGKVAKEISKGIKQGLKDEEE